LESREDESVHFANVSKRENEKGFLKTRGEKC
jgi:hypothetical protein